MATAGPLGPPAQAVGSTGRVTKDEKITSMIFQQNRIVTFHRRSGCPVLLNAMSWRFIFSSFLPGRRDKRLIACVTRV